MESNGHPEIGSYESYLASRLQRLEASGMAPEAVKGLRARGGNIQAELVKFRDTRKSLTESGRYSPSGLREALSEAAAAAAGAIRRAADDSGLRDNIQQHKAKLVQTTTKDSSERLIDFWKQMELRTLYQQMGITLMDPTTGRITVDTVKADLFYQEALTTGNHDACQALEQWPLTCPVSPELIAKGQGSRMRDRDPVVAQRLQEMTDLQEAQSQTLKDALVELKEFLPVPDPIAEKATRNEFAE